MLVPVFNNLEVNTIYIASRPVDLPVLNRFDHEQLIFATGPNTFCDIGFFKDGGLRPDEEKYYRLGGVESSKQYCRIKKTEINFLFARLIVQKVGERTEKGLFPFPSYEFVTCNCQHFVKFIWKADLRLKISLMKVRNLVFHEASYILTQVEKAILEVGYEIYKDSYSANHQPSMLVPHLENGEMRFNYGTPRPVEVWKDISAGPCPVQLPFRKINKTENLAILAGLNSNCTVDELCYPEVYKKYKPHNSISMNSLGGMIGMPGLVGMFVNSYVGALSPLYFGGGGGFGGSYGGGGGGGGGVSSSGGDGDGGGGGGDRGGGDVGLAGDNDPELAEAVRLSLLAPLSSSSSLPSSSADSSSRHDLGSEQGQELVWANVCPNDMQPLITVMSSTLGLGGEEVCRKSCRSCTASYMFDSTTLKFISTAPPE